MANDKSPSMICNILPRVMLTTTTGLEDPDLPFGQADGDPADQTDLPPA